MTEPQSRCRGCGKAIEQPPRGGERIWCSQKCRRDTCYPSFCIVCGVPIGNSGAGNGPRKSRYCTTHGREHVAKVARERADREMAPKRELVIAMIAERKTNVEIAQATGSTPNAISVFINRLRQRGYEIPDRRRYLR